MLILTYFSYLLGKCGTLIFSNKDQNSNSFLLQEFRGRSILEIQQAATRSQRSNYGSTSNHLQGFSYSNQYNYVPQSNLRTSGENNFLTTVCLALLVCFVFVVIIILGNAKR